MKILKRIFAITGLVLVAFILSYFIYTGGQISA